MKIEQLPTGSYRIRKTYKGKTYTITTKYKPTQKEALMLMAEKLNQIDDKKSANTFKGCYEAYIKLKNNVLSPSTIRGYGVIKNNLPEWFLELNINDITQADVQKLVNEYAENHKPKSTRNMHGLVSAILSLNRPNLVIRTTLPQRVLNEPYIPTDSDIKTILKHAEGTEWEVGLWLAVFGLRRSEILALQYPDDLEGNVLHISKALVPDADENYVIKSTKTTDSTRDIFLPDSLVKKIHAKKHFVSGHPNSLSEYLTDTEKALGLPHFSLHKLRHYYASQAHTMGIPDSYIQASGGWKTDSVMKNVYRHAMQDKLTENQQKYANHVTSLL